MEQLKAMKEQLTSIVQSQLAHTDSVDTKELGEAVDMIKDLAEAIYYCSITEAMDESKDKGNTYYYTTYNQHRPDMMTRYDEIFDPNRMFYGGQGAGPGNIGQGSNNSSGGSRMYRTGRRINPVYYQPDYREYDYPGQMMPDHDPREGRARKSRRMYIESKELHKDSATQMKELEKYIQDLSKDVTEMIEHATPEEKQLLQQKIMTLSTKIN